MVNGVIEYWVQSFGQVHSFLNDIENIPEGPIYQDRPTTHQKGTSIGQVAWVHVQAFQVITVHSRVKKLASLSGRHQGHNVPSSETGIGYFFSSA